MFIHLRLHTECSVVDGTTRVDEIVKAAAADGQPALAITDLSNLFAAIKFYKEGRKLIPNKPGANVSLQLPRKLEGMTRNVGMHAEYSLMP